MSNVNTRERAASRATVALPKLDAVKSSLPVVASSFVLIMSLLCLVGLRMETTRLSTQLTDLHKTRNALSLEVDKLRTEQGFRVRPGQLEKSAKLLGLVRPRTEEIIILDE